METCSCCVSICTKYNDKLTDIHTAKYVHTPISLWMKLEIVLNVFPNDMSCMWTQKRTKTTKKHKYVKLLFMKC